VIPFDPAGPLPEGTVLLQASAGTGKTYAIAALATRYLAEGRVSVEHLAVISFSRVASDELRTRVRTRLRDSAAVLADAVAGRPLDGLDDGHAALCTGTPSELAERERRLRAAISGLDSAGIMTIHQFCEAMFDELGVQAVEDPGARLVEDLTVVREQVVEDLYLARYANAAEPPFNLATAHRLGMDAVRFPDLGLVPAGATGVAAERMSFAAGVRQELAARKRLLGVYSFDDQLLRLRDSLVAAGPVGAERLRRRCRVVLVDEFQDTDPVQWAILRDTFAGHVPLVLIGDPKQAIYGFRGADVAAYVDAVATSGERFSLTVNHRADPGVVSGVSGLFGSVSLGPEVEVEPVTAAHPAPRLLRRGVAGPAVRLRWVESANPLARNEARRRIDADLVAEVSRLLTSGLEFADAHGVRLLAARDVAVLVSTNDRGREIAAELASAGVPVAFSGADSVFASAAAKDWLALLRALDQPRRATVRAAILTDFVGADLTELALADDDRLSAWSAVLQGWARVLDAQGVAALFAAVQASVPELGGGLAERELRRSRGERELTDHRQLAELLHAQYSAGVRGPELVGWLAEQIRQPGDSGDRTRRLETDAQAVQVMTVHKAKGLEFPVVLLPQAAETWVVDTDDGENFDLHDETRVRVLDLAGAGTPGRAERFALWRAEQAEDRLRALYVAATRAQSRLVMWWAPTWNHTAASPLHRLLFRDRARPGTPEPTYPVDRTPDELDWLAGAGMTAEPCTDALPAQRMARTETPAALVAPVWQRVIDPLWRRTSYSGLTEAVHARAPLAALAAEPVLADEPSGAGDYALSEDAGGTPSPMADLPGGAAFGSLVHQVLEHLDWHAPDPATLDRRLLVATTAASSRFPVAGVTPQALAEALRPSLLTPLGPLTGGRALAEIATADRLSELTFEFPLGADRSRTDLGDVAALLRRRLPADDPLAEYADDLAAQPLAGQVLRGFLTGSIDSVLRIPGEAGTRFVVIDYKTNRLGPADLRLEHYRLPTMVAEMRRTHYPLQALLYCVALHRFLLARLDAYDPARHLGGVGYLFVRGLGGPETGDGTGVFAWHPPADLVVELSDLLADRRWS
jgi:exodeoxyribonuclease V beta subunit